ncbi:MAG TPA: dephospho-CoA kinase [Desulfobacteria bacterium]|nr:dephospho-CoA kinase [Desulfobacteria bacterium]
MPIIGLTGSIATGKSMVSGFLQQMGIRVIDADLVAREIVAPGLPAWRQIRDYFGEEVLDPDLSINRKNLADEIFGDKEKISKLNEITHPVIIEKITSEINEFRSNGSNDREILVVDVPLLIETGMHKIVDKVWVVYVPEELQLKRLMDRDGLTHTQAVKRIKSQMPVSEKKKYADAVIDNSGSITETKEKVGHLVSQLLGESGGQKIEN